MNRLPSCKVSGALLLALVAVIMGMILAQPDRADAAVYPMEDPTRAVNHLRVTYVEYLHQQDSLLYVEFNDGSTAAFTPCRNDEPGRNCYWAALLRGNHEGRSFVVLHEQMHYIRHDVLVNAGLA